MRIQPFGRVGAAGGGVAEEPVARAVGVSEATAKALAMATRVETARKGPNSLGRCSARSAGKGQAVRGSASHRLFNAIRRGRTDDADHEIHDSAHQNDT